MTSNQETICSIRRMSHMGGYLAAAIAASLMLVLVVSAPALAKAPTGDFAVFVQCPRTTPEVNFCLYSETTSGEVTIGTSVVPIEHTIVLQGGFHKPPVAKEAETFYGAVNGETLSHTPQTVPGGLLGLVNCSEIKEPVAKLACELVFENGLTGVTATTELAESAGAIGINTNNLVNRRGIALSLPIKVHLENPFLGGSCYIGSSASPVTLDLTTGTTSPPEPNKPISGKVGTIEFGDEFNFTDITNNTLVDNAFSAPEATGCGGLLSSVIDPVIDAKLGLPSPGGKNTAIQNNRIREAVAEAVIKSEE